MVNCRWSAHETTIGAILRLKNPVYALRLHLSFILILFSHQRLGLPNCLCSSCFHTKHNVHLPTFACVTHTPACLVLLDLITLIVCCEEQKSQSSLVWHFLQSPVTSFPLLLPHCERPRSILSKNNSSTTAFYFSVFKFIANKEEDKIYGPNSSRNSTDFSFS